MIRKLPRGLVLVFLLPTAALLLIMYLLYGLLLQVAIWLLWVPRGKSVLLVYSNSPHWKDYVEREIIPRLSDRAVILNWSERDKWQKDFSLSAMAFNYFGGYREFNPLGVVFRPFHWAKVFRFWQAFRDLRHGKDDLLRKTAEGLFQTAE